ncbi:MAG: hypothetical protein VX498_00870, partial [Myxococcota bacterium]|nr:hypothetical protein [Myxococcota bacterium]
GISAETETRTPSEHDVLDRLETVLAEAEEKAQDQAELALSQDLRQLELRSRWEAALAQARRERNRRLESSDDEEPAWSRDRTLESIFDPHPSNDRKTKGSQEQEP